MLVFFVIWIAFVQLMYLFFNEKSVAYADLLRSILTSFQILLGKFELGPLLEGNPFFGSILFLSYNIIIVLLLMNTFISIICESFEAVREELVGKPNDFEVFDWIESKIMRVVNFLKPKKKVATTFEEDEDEEERLEKERLKLVNENLHLVLSQRVDNLINICGVVN